MPKHTRLAGRWLMSVALVHAPFGLWFGRDVLVRIAADGFVNAVESHLDRNLVFWFLMASPLMWLVGRLAVWLGSRGVAPPAWLGFQLLALTALGVVLMPVSGFWLVLPPALLLVAASRPPQLEA